MKATQKEIESALYGRRKNRRVEHSIQDAIVEWVNLLPGFTVWRSNTGAAKFTDKHGKKRLVRFGKVGQGDLMGIGPHGIHLEIEVKKDEDCEPSDLQKDHLQIIRESGGIAFHCFSLEMCVVKMRQEFINRGWDWNRRWEI